MCIEESKKNRVCNKNFMSNGDVCEGYQEFNFERTNVHGEKKDANPFGVSPQFSTLNERITCKTKTSGPYIYCIIITKRLHTDFNEKLAFACCVMYLSLLLNSEIHKTISIYFDFIYK